METANLIKQEIFNNIDNPKQLEILYRKDKTAFQKVFNSIYPNLTTNSVAQIWNERLNYKQEELNWGKKNELVFIVVAALIAVLITQIPQFFKVDNEQFYTRNIGFLAFPMLILYFFWKQNLAMDKLIFPLLSILFSAIYINAMPFSAKADTLLLTCIHLPIFLWSVLGYSFMGNQLNSTEKRIGFLKYNGNAVVMCAIILLSGILFSIITMGLFKLLGFHIEELYFKYIVLSGLAATPIVGSYLVQNNPELVNKISPIIAKIFTPLVFLVLLIFLMAIIYSGKDPYKDRDFLIVFNALLIGVMAIILFSITESAKNKPQKIHLIILFGLSLLTIIDNGIALSAIAFRLSEFGISPNRLAVLGGNLLIFIHLLLVAHKLYLLLMGKCALEKVENAIAIFLPIYFIWAAIVAFVFPIIFHFK
jgi:hypothetical protein